LNFPTPTAKPIIPFPDTLLGGLSSEERHANHTAVTDGPSVSCALKKQLPFIAEFERFHNLLTFPTSSGKIDVRSFGVTSGWGRWGKALGQIQVLDDRSPDDFIIRIGNLSG
jgi:hypothetical protein